MIYSHYQMNANGHDPVIIRVSIREHRCHLFAYQGRSTDKGRIQDFHGGGGGGATKDVQRSPKPNVPYG